MAGKSDLPFVIGVTGPVGSGVSTVATALEENEFGRISLSDPIKAELRKRLNLVGTLPFNESNVHDFRKQLQDIGNDGRRTNPHCWVEKAVSEIGTANQVVIDGIRNLEELRWLRERFSPHFFLIALHSAPDVRWARVMKDYDQNLKLFKRDDLRDAEEDELHGQQVTKCVQQADYVLVNEGSDGTTATQKSKLFGLLRDDLVLMREVGRIAGGYRRTANPSEVHMATAYAQSHSSQCMKRHVGAIIVGPDNLPLSLGYNENPVGMKPCINEFRHCFKDEDMHVKLEKMEDACCPSCGQKQSRIVDPWTCINEKCRANMKLALFPSRNMELCTAIHAEERAIRSLAGRSAANATMYTTTFPCFQCSRYIVDAGIKRVVYVEPYPVKESEEFLKRNKVSVDPFNGFKARAFSLIFKQVE